MSRRDVYRARAELNAIKPHPDLGSVALPPQPSILPAPKPPVLVRAAAKFDTFTRKRLGPTRRVLVKAKNLRHIRTSSPASLISGITFKHEQKPVVSIVIPVYNKVDLTIACLRSLQEHVSLSIPYEVIVVDNNSSDDSHLLNAMRGLNYIRNKENLGFVEGCNAGAAAASGEYLIFLNNDALVTANWLESLLGTIESNHEVGLVGSKIIYPDGRLQEAGGIIFQDGSGWNYGRGDHPDRYQYNYVREVDYCSGASIIIRKDLFDSYGGFDMHYAPAYYEDTDLAFKVRQSGLKVLYQPQSVIYHIEGATAGTSTSSGFKKYQAINHDKFLERWQKTLLKEHAVIEDVYAARDRTHQKLALLVEEFVPMPDKDSGSVRTVRMIELLQELGYKVTLFPNHLQKIEGYTEQLQQKGVEVVYGPTPFNSFIEEFGKYYDAVILSRPRIGAYFIELCQAYCTKAKILYDTVDLHYLRLRRQSTYEKGELKEYYDNMADKHEVVEKDLMLSADATLVVSDTEAEMLKKDGVNNVAIVSNIHEINDDAYDIKFDSRKDLVFIGGYAHLPNIDAVKWFVDDIFPLILQKLPQIKFHVIGSNMPNELAEYLHTKENVIVDGFIEDLTPLLSTSRVFVAPIRFGAGVKGKVGQAVEFGIPVVSTKIGAEGMHMNHGESVMVAADPKEFARYVIELYTKEKQWLKVRVGAKESVTKYLSKSAAKNTLRQLLSK